MTKDDSIAGLNNIKLHIGVKRRWIGEAYNKIISIEVGIKSNFYYKFGRYFKNSRDNQ